MMNGSQEILRALRPRTVIIRSIAATMSSGTKTTLRELNDEEVRRRRYPARPRPNTHRAPIPPRSPPIVAYPNHRSNPPHQTPTGVPRLQGIRERRPRLVRQVPTNDRPAQAPAPKPGVSRRVLSRQRPEEGQGCKAGSLHSHGATRDRVAGRQRR